MSDLRVDDLAKSYLVADHSVDVLSHLTFNLDRGESLAVVGPSGVGKSTLLHLLGTLDRPTSGSIVLLDQDYSTISERDAPSFRSKHIGFIFQDHFLLPQINAIENVLIPALANSNTTAAYSDRAMQLLAAVGLKDRAYHLPSQLSGGEKQRVAIARALLLSPTLVLADEPTGNLDPENARRIAELLLQLQSKENTLMIVVTHAQEIASMMTRKLELGRQHTATERVPIG